jgi:hypothetical protein
LRQDDGKLNSMTYAKATNTYLNKSQWEVWGKESFWGSKTVTVQGDAKGSAAGTGYFYGGTYKCGEGCTNADAIVRAIVQK